MRDTVEKAMQSERRGAGSLWAGVLAAGAGGGLAAWGVSVEVTAVVVACTLAGAIGVVEWRRLQTLREYRAARSKVREVLYGGVSEERDQVVQAILESDEGMWELGDIDEDDPVMWIVGDGGVGKSDAVAAVGCGQALRMVEGWQSLCELGMKNERARLRAGLRVLAAVSSMGDEKRKQLSDLSRGWDGTLDEAVKAVLLQG